MFYPITEKNTVLKSTSSEKTILGKTTETNFIHEKPSDQKVFSFVLDDGYWMLAILANNKLMATIADDQDPASSDHHPVSGDHHPVSA